MGVVLLSGLLLGVSGTGAAREGVTRRAEPFPLSDVRLLPGPCLTAQEANRQYLLLLHPDRLLYTFRQNAGLPAPGEPLGGWEAPQIEVRGHFVGHYLSACALMVASTGDTAVKDRADLLVAELAKCQAAHGNGYLSAFPEAFWDRLESLRTPPWAPFYVIHKILVGLLDVHRLCGNNQALAVARGLAGYFQGRFAKLDIRAIDQLLNVEQGGMSDGLYQLYALTGDRAHFAHAHQHERAAFLGALAMEHDNLSGLHANTHIPEVIGAARRYELTGDPRFRTIAEYFWRCVTEHRSYATGGSNSGEHWPLPDRLAGTLGTTTQESCTTYNMLKLTGHLFAWSGAPAYGDFAELAFWNGILGTQRAGDGQLIYYLPLNTGATKTYGTPYDSFWCCYGTGVETFSKLADGIFWHDERGLLVQQFLPAEVEWRERGVRLEQRTGFPDEPATRLIVHCERPARFALRVRLPRWLAGAPAIQLNGRPAAVGAQPGTFAELDREWRDGDTVTVSLPMRLAAVPMPDDPELVAVRYGPLVLAGLTDHDRLFLADPADPASWLEPVPGETLTFRAKDQPEPMTLVPLHRVLDQRYGVYWTVTQPGSPRHQQILAEEEARRQRAARIIDAVTPNNAESENAHGLTGERHGSGPLGGRGWRHAVEGGWFSYSLRVTADAPVILSVTYWGSDAGAREFDVLVDGTPLETRRLNNERPGRFFEVDLPLPAELTQGKASITVKFQAKPGNFAGGVFGVATLRPE